MVDKTQQTAADVPSDAPAETEDERISRLVDARMAEREKMYNQAVTAARSLSGALVPADSDGPGYGNPRESWCLAQQEASRAGLPFE